MCSDLIIGTEWCHDYVLLVLGSCIICVHWTVSNLCVCVYMCTCYASMHMCVCVWAYRLHHHWSGMRQWEIEISTDNNTTVLHVCVCVWVYLCKSRGDWWPKAISFLLHLIQVLSLQHTTQHTLQINNDCSAYKVIPRLVSASYEYS